MDSTVTRKGQTTVPKPVRDHLKLKPGDRVKFFFDRYGGVVRLKVLPVTALPGMAAQPSRPVWIEDMNRAIAAGAAGEPLPNEAP